MNFMRRYKEYVLCDTPPMMAAMERAQLKSPAISVVDAEDRLFMVWSTSSDAQYLVHFLVTYVEDYRLIYASCRLIEGLEPTSVCPAMEFGTLCYHVGAAAALNLAIQNEDMEEMKTLEAKLAETAA